MPVVPGPPTHRAIVQVFDGEMIDKDQLVRYEGEPNWKFEPLEPVEAVRWREKVARPSRALQENLRTKDVLRPDPSPEEKAREETLRRRSLSPIRLSI